MLFFGRILTHLYIKVQAYGGTYTRGGGATSDSLPKAVPETLRGTRVPASKYPTTLPASLLSTTQKSQVMSLTMRSKARGAHEARRELRNPPVTIVGCRRYVWGWGSV